jgi:hypothetical protein
MGLDGIMEDVLKTMICIPVIKPILINQCGTWSIAYPAEYNRDKKAKRKLQPS